MRSALTLGLVTIFTAALAQQPPIDIKPRLKGPAVAPEGETSIDRRANIRVDTTLVLIPVAVTDPMSRFVTGLDKENFKLFEDKTEQVITQFSSEDAPLSVGIVFDTSGSMAARSRNPGRPWRNS